MKDRGRLWVLVILLIANAGCRCVEQLAPVQTKLEASLGEAGPWAESVLLDFGELWGAPQVQRPLFLRNAGTVSVSLQAAENLPAALDVPLVGRSLSSGEVISVPITVKPGEATLELLTSFEVTTEGEGASVTVSVAGRLLPLECELPTRLDFGVVATGTESQRTIVFSNPSRQEVVLDLGAVIFERGEPLAFGVIEPLTGRLTIPPSETRSARYVYRPSVEGEASASVYLRAAPACAPQRVEFVGRAVSQVLTWQPSALDCEWQQPGTAQRRPIVFTNQGSSPVTLFNARVDGGAFSLSDQWTTSTLIAAGQSVSRDIVCNPTMNGESEGELFFSSDLDSQPSGVVPLRVSGAGPRLVAPVTVAFGLASEMPSSRWLLLANEGGPASAPPAITDLRITSATVTPANGNTLASEVEVESTWPLELAVGQRAAVKVRLRPLSTGPKAATITLETNDKLHEQATIHVTAQVNAYAPCVAQLSESSLEFGIVHATNPMTRRLLVRNTSADRPCLVFGELSPSTPSDFTSASTPPVELGPGATMELAVRLQPRQAVGPTVRPITGTLELQISDLNLPELNVPLSGAAGPACLGILPGELNFGTITPGTSSPLTRLRIVNHCIGARVPPIIIAPLRLVDALIVGDPEFELVAPSPFPVGGLEIPYDGESSIVSDIAPMTEPVALRYSPVSPGRHRGAVIVWLEQSGVTWKQVIPLRGMADSSRATQDDFIQGGGDAVDIVLVRSRAEFVGAGNSNWDWSLARFKDTADLFFTHLTRANSDFRLGVVVTEFGAIGAQWYGAYRLDSLATNPIIDVNTANPAESLRARWSLPQACRDEFGAVAPCTHMLLRYPTFHTWRAVTEPTASALNGGPPRPSARLSLLSFTMHAEERATTYYPWGNPTLPHSVNVADTGDIVRMFQELKGVQHPELLSWAGMTGMNFEHHEPGGRCDFSDGAERSRVYATPLLILKAAARAEVEEVCPADPAEFDESVERLAEVASGLKTHFPLSAPADDLSPIQVFVDGVIAPTSAWTFNARRNEVHFSLMQTPSPGQRIKVRYFTKP